MTGGKDEAVPLLVDHDGVPYPETGPGLTQEWYRGLFPVETSNHAD